MATTKEVKKSLRKLHNFLTMMEQDWKNKELPKKYMEFFGNPDEYCLVTNGHKGDFSFLGMKTTLALHIKKQETSKGGYQ